MDTVRGLVFFIVSTPFIPSQYGSLAWQGSADDKSRVWTVAWTEYKFMAGTLFVVSAKD